MSDAQAEIPKIIQLGPGLYVRQEVDNIAWIDFGDGMLVVDALEQASLEAEVFSAVESTCPGRAVRFVLNTHTHYDHVALNGAFARRLGAQIVNQEVSPLPPEGRWFEGPLRKVHMLPMPGCHTPEDCIVWVEPDGVLFVGDIFGWGCIPLIVNLRRETLTALEETFARLIAYDAKTIVPGHGPLCTTDNLRRWLDHLHELIGQVRELFCAGTDEAKIAQAIRPPADMTDWWRFLKWKHADCVARVIKAVRNGWL